MTKFITQAEYARRRGVSRQAVGKAVAFGRITLVNGLVDVKAADRQWRDNSMPRWVSGEPPDTLDGTAAAHSDAYYTVLKCLRGRMTRLASLLVRVKTTARMRKLLGAAMEEIADELERAGLL